MEDYFEDALVAFGCLVTGAIAAGVTIAAVDLLLTVFGEK